MIHGLERSALCFLLYATLPAAALGNNGLNLSGYGGTSTAMGGADVALSHDTFAINANPAGMTRIQGSLLDLYAAPYYTDNRHSDNVGNDRESGDAKVGGWVAAGYVRPLRENLTGGIALFVQGGAGFAYDELSTVFSNAGIAARDDISSTFSVVKLATALAWRVNERWSVGAAVGVNYAAAKQEFLPNTSTPSFQGFTFEGADGFGVSARVGVQFHPTETLTFGATYGTKTQIALRGGVLDANYQAAGAGVVRYREAYLSGFRLPQEIAVGMAFRPAPRLLTSLQYKWYDWSIVRDFALTARRPDFAGAGIAPEIVITSPVRLRDQHVAQLGFAYDYSGSTKLLAGFNYARRPMPRENLNPVFALIQEPHIMLGADRRLNDRWRLVGAIELYPRQFETNPTANPIFGTDMTESQAGVVVHVTASRRW